MLLGSHVLLLEIGQRLIGQRRRWWWWSPRRFVGSQTDGLGGDVKPPFTEKHLQGVPRSVPRRGILGQRERRFQTIHHELVRHGARCMCQAAAHEHVDEPLRDEWVVEVCFRQLGWILPAGRHRAKLSNACGVPSTQGRPGQGLVGPDRRTHLRCNARWGRVSGPQHDHVRCLVRRAELLPDHGEDRQFEEAAVQRCFGLRVCELVQGAQDFA